MLESRDRYILLLVVKFVLRTTLWFARIVAKEKLRRCLVLISKAVDRRGPDF